MRSHRNSTGCSVEVRVLNVLDANVLDVQSSVRLDSILNQRKGRVSDGAENRLRERFFGQRDSG